MEVSGKVVIITGASEGIGLATARLFGRLGASIALVARREDKLQELTVSLPHAFVVPTDMRDEAAVRHMVAEVHRQYGRIDIVINNAAQGLRVPLERVSMEQYRSIFELNVIGVLVAVQATIPLMREQGGGVIVNISSSISKMAIPGVGPYASTKSALNCLTLTARQELATDNIRVGLVYPRRTATAFNEHLINGPWQHSGFRMMGIEPAESTEYVAEKILEAVQTEAAEVSW